MFVLASNHFRKYFSVNAGVWLRMENGFSGKEFQLIVKLRPLTRKIFSTKILPSNHFRRHAKREREREREQTQKTQDRHTTSEIVKLEIVEPKKPKIVAPRTHEPRVASRTHEPANPLPISFSFSFEIFVIKFVCDFDFFTFSL